MGQYRQDRLSYPLWLACILERSADKVGATDGAGCKHRASLDAGKVRVIQFLFAAQQLTYKKRFLVSDLLLGISPSSVSATKGKVPRLLRTSNEVGYRFEDMGTLRILQGEWLSGKCSGKLIVDLESKETASAL